MQMAYFPSGFQSVTFTDSKKKKNKRHKSETLGYAQVSEGTQSR